LNSRIKLYVYTDRMEYVISNDDKDLLCHMQNGNFVVFILLVSIMRVRKLNEFTSDSEPSRALG
jgi:hypothetical protein